MVWFRLWRLFSPFSRSLDREDRFEEDFLVEGDLVLDLLALDRDLDRDLDDRRCFLGGESDRLESSSLDLSSSVLPPLAVSSSSLAEPERRECLPRRLLRCDDEWWCRSEELLSCFDERCRDEDDDEDGLDFCAWRRISSMDTCSLLVAGIITACVEWFTFFWCICVLFRIY